MKPFRINRRFILRGLGGIGIGLPLLEVMDPIRRSFGQAASAPRRFVAMYSANGTIYNNWKPTGSATNFTLSPILMPLAPVQSDIVVVDGLIDKAAQAVSGDDHQKGMVTMLTGISPPPGTGTNVGLSGGISVDQAIAKQIGAATAFSSLEFGVQAGASGSPLTYMAFAGAGQPLPAQDDPTAMYKRIFSSFTPPTPGGNGSGGAGGGGGAGPSAAMILLNERRSVLDAALDSYNSLLPKVSANDRVKLQAHATRIRDLENRLLQMNSSGSTGAGGGNGGGGSGTSIASCSKPPAPATVAFKQNANLPLVAQLQEDLLIMALACDLTRVATLQFTHESADPVMSWVDPAITRGHHTMSHDADTVVETLAFLTAINAWYAKQFGYLVAKMKSIAEGGGTMLDNTLLVWMNGLAKGNFHSHSPMPIVAAGRAGGTVTTGRFLSYAGTNTNNLLLSCLNAMGGKDTAFGNPAFCTGPLAGFLK